MRKLSFLMVILFALQLTGCTGFFLRMYRLEQATFAPELSKAYKKNVGLDTLYDVSAGDLTLADIHEKTHPAVRKFLIDFIHRDDFDYKKHLKFNLVKGYIMDAVMKRDGDESATVYLVHVNFGGEKDDALGEKQKAFFEVWHIGGRVTKEVHRVDGRITYVMDVEKKQEFQYYDNGEKMSEFHGDFFNDTDGAVRYSGIWTLYSERGVKAIECEISDGRLDQGSCVKTGEKVDVSKLDSLLK
ncbi:hypothetical protein [Fibrobacter succinogenes]|uniref:hypothetical protein n=1 Tax=Fibrobacter succinogenes TaxID=833 RepID=UPI001564CE76|nr:hypothetical protein [Fibrobacter succinogenes]